MMPALNKVALFSKEYPPYVYGGAGVHVEYLSRALARQIEVEVRCFGDQEITAANPAVHGYAEWPEAKEHTDPRFAGAVDAFARSLAMAKDRLDADVVHCHTGTPTWAVCWRASSGTCRTCSPSTRSNRSAPGRSSSSATPII